MPREGGGPDASAEFPIHLARTRRFTLGRPRDLTIAPDGSRVVFLRSRAGDDPTNCLWSLDLDSGDERVVVDPRRLGGAGPADELPAAERVRRERARELAGGVVAYAADRGVRLGAFAWNGELWVVPLTSEGAPRRLATPGSVVDPRLDPGGMHVAYLAGGELRVAAADGTDDRALATPEAATVMYGAPEHVASESMHRSRGYWWSPDGTHLLAARVDTAPVQRWYQHDPTYPERAPVEFAYPAAGTRNADVSLWLLGLDGERREVRWDRAAFEYLVAVAWSSARPIIAVERRDQRELQILDVDPSSGSTSLRHVARDPAWVTFLPGTPALTASGDLVWTVDDADTRRLLVGETVVTPAGLEVREVLDVDGDTVLFSASSEPTTIDLWTFGRRDGLTRLTPGDGVHDGRRTGGVTIVISESLDDDDVRVTVQRPGAGARTIASHVERPVLRPRVSLCSLGTRSLRAALVLPSWHEPGARRLPVLMDPYGGPAAQRVVAASHAYLTSQWFAEQGYAVVIVDGRGTPGRGPRWERTIHLNTADPVLTDQVDGLDAMAERCPDLDLEHVGIRGWSFGGYLAALAVLRRPDRFHAGVAGAAPFDQRLYDTHWRERFLGDPAEHPDVYDHASLLADAAGLRRPLLMIHGLSDDNVVVAHTLRFSAALLAAGRMHNVMLLPRASHMIPEPQMVRRRLELEAEFFRRSLARPYVPDPVGT